MKNWFIFAGIILILALVFMAGRCSKSCPEIIESVEVVKKDLPEVKKEIEKPRPVRSYPAPKKTMAFIKDSDSSNTMAILPMANPCDSISEYSETLEDSNGVVTVKSTVHGMILKQDIIFKAKMTYIKETKKVLTPSLMRSFYIGAEAGVGPAGTLRIAPAAEYLDKKGNAFSYNYDLLNKVHSAGYKKRIF